MLDDVFKNTAVEAVGEVINFGTPCAAYKNCEHAPCVKVRGADGVGKQLCLEDFLSLVFGVAVSFTEFAPAISKPGQVQGVVHISDEAKRLLFDVAPNAVAGVLREMKCEFL